MPPLGVRASRWQIPLRRLRSLYHSRAFPTNTIASIPDGTVAWKSRRSTDAPEYSSMSAYLRHEETAARDCAAAATAGERLDTALAVDQALRVEVLAQWRRRIDTLAAVEAKVQKGQRWLTYLSLAAAGIGSFALYGGTLLWLGFILPMCEQILVAATVLAFVTSCLTTVLGDAALCLLRALQKRLHEAARREGLEVSSSSRD